MCVTDCHDMTLAVKVALNPNTTSQSFRGLIIPIAREFIPLSPLSIVSTGVMLESSQWLGKNIMRNIGQKNSRKAWIGAMSAAM